MSNTLTSVDETNTNAHLIGAAIANVERKGGSLVVLYAMPEQRYRTRQRAIGADPDRRKDGATYTITQAEQAAERVATRVAEEAIGRRDIPFIPIGSVGIEEQLALAAAE